MMRPMGKPFVSVVIPARNAAGAVTRSVEAALAQDYPGPFEVIVADGASTDGTAQAAAEAGARVVLNPEVTTPAGLNAAIAAARGEIIARCDAHAVLPPGYLSRAVETLERTGAANVGGLQTAVGEGFFQRAVAIAQSTPLGVGDARYRLGGEPGPVDTVYLGVFRRSALERVGGFDPSFERNQDYELNWRLRAAGEVVWFDPGLSVEYTPRRGVAPLARQYFDYGRWKRVMIGLHPSSVRLRQLAAPLLVGGLIGSIGLAFTPWRWTALVLPAAYLAALGATATWELVRRRDPAAVALPLAIPVMHLAWGWGFLLARPPTDTPGGGVPPAR
jgi:glycosyltransferase involved in cell wall biosynthesis